MPRATLIDKIASVIKEDLDVEGGIVSKDYFLLSSKDKQSIDVDTGIQFRDRLAQQLAGVLVMEMENTPDGMGVPVLQSENFVKTTTSYNSDEKVKRVPFVKFYTQSDKDVNYHMVKEGNATNRLMNYIDPLFGKESEKRGFYLAGETKEKIQTRLDNGQKVGDKAEETLETIRDEIEFSLNPGMVAIANLNPKELLDLFNLDMRDVPPLALLELGIPIKEVSDLYFSDKKAQSYFEINQQYEGRIRRNEAIDDMGVLKFKGKILQVVDTIKTLQTLAPVANKALAMDAKIGGNGRIYLSVFGTASIQADKLLRHIVQSQNMFKNITISESSKKFGFWKLDMVQALDRFTPEGSDYVAEDKNTPERTAKEFCRYSRKYQ